MKAVRGRQRDQRQMTALGQGGRDGIDGSISCLGGWKGKTLDTGWLVLHLLNSKDMAHIYQAPNIATYRQ